MFFRSLLLSLLCMCTLLPAAAPAAQPDVFDLPALQARFTQVRLAVAILLKQNRWEEAERGLRQAIALVPHDPVNYYNLGCAQAQQGKADEAFTSLNKAVELGFNNLKQLREDPDLARIRDEARFSRLLDSAAVATPKPNPWQFNVEARPVADRKALVSESNTAWNAKNGVFISLFKLPDEPDKSQPVIIKHGEEGELIRGWYAEGTAAGNHGDLYDNHDGDHSNFAYNMFPQFTAIEFDEQAKRRKFNIGLQNRFFYNGIVIGNASMAMVGSPYWRSQPRLAYANARQTALLYAQYTRNHLYVYPEHNDHDAKYGDVFPANTPYVITSQGSSGSDRAFLDALACTLAAFRPEVKELLAKNGLIAPTLQMIFRMSNAQVKEQADYLTGKAHPSVFDGRHINVLKMVNLAHDIQKDDVPPMVQLKVVEEDDSKLGIDYFDAADRQKLFDTPCAIARIHRTTRYRYRMVVSAEDSRDVNNRELKYDWVVLRGNEVGIKINKLNEQGSVVELSVPYQSRAAISPGSGMTSSRVDIGVFVNNGKYYSAPGFVTFYTFDNEKRSYFRNGLIESVTYISHLNKGPYVDPMIDIPKDWKDSYHYTDDNQLIGWTRTRGEEKERFTSDGALILKTDESNRALQARTVRYTAKRLEKQPPVLEQQLGNEILYYQYESDQDQVGRVVKRETLQ